jgi:hypothetical protein
MYPSRLIATAYRMRLIGTFPKMVDEPAGASTGRVRPPDPSPECTAFAPSLDSHSRRSPDKAGSVR